MDVLVDASSSQHSARSGPVTDRLGQNDPGLDPPGAADSVGEAMDVLGDREVVAKIEPIEEPAPW